MPHPSSLITVTLTMILIVLTLLPQVTLAQFRNGTSKFQQKKAQGEEELVEQIQSHDDVKEYFFPEKLYANIDIYRTEIPLSQEYTIGVMVSPCGDNSTLGVQGSVIMPFDCCQGIFGDGEYGYLTDAAMATYDVEYPIFRAARSDPMIPSESDEIFENSLLVDDRGQLKTLETSRRADDEVVVAEECTGINEPFPYCMGVRLQKKKYSQMAACTDNNETVNAMLDCYSVDGFLSPHCIQVAYSQSSFIHICGGDFADDPHCGTYLEVHRLNGSPYDSEEVLLSDQKIITRETSGMVTTTLPLFYKGDPTKILCNFKETVIRVGAMVLIKEQAPICCCPGLYNTLNRVGRFLCPNKAGTNHGPFADAVNTLEEERNRDDLMKNYPYCPVLDEHEDKMVCSKQATKGFSQDTMIEKIGKFSSQMRFYSEPCALANYSKTENTWSSDDLGGNYPGKCEYFDSCGMLTGNQKYCASADDEFTFAGYIGKVVEIPVNLDDPDGIYKVTFNDGRTVYNFLLADLELMEPKYNYEIWFVQRTPYDFVIQQRKPLKVINPKCTYDIVNQRYFPFAQLDAGGYPLNQGDGGFDGKEAPPDYYDPIVFYEDDGSVRRLEKEGVIDLDKVST
ncbi:hypothetical protein TL16_g05462 [Triparma laevis f. inornata]|uniref:Uncharacterized protein n=1 Tax=Triparma laevis f. inornata TaxID=1714386 RepID=A0A9W7E9A9_9STRA|nr:hypothetical protein TL16_g05462 [Triparma laevis f. inornata]